MTAKPVMRDLPHLAARLFGTPLLVDARKLDLVVPAFLRRLNGEPDDAEPLPAPARESVEPAISSGIAVIPAIGSLVRRKTAMQAWSGMTSYGDIAEALRSALDDARVRGILLQIDSFGGEVGGCFELCDEIFAARAVKPVWAVADINALSAGFAIGSCAERFYMAPSGEVGSVGVVAVHCEASQLNEALGVTYTVLRAGTRKADGNPFERLAPELARKLQASMDRNRLRFARMVVRNRPAVSFPALLATEGTWLEADEAQALNLVDGVMTFEAAFAALAAAVAPGTVRAMPSPAAPAPDGDELPAPDPELAEGGPVMDPKDTSDQPAAVAAATAAPPAPPPPSDNVVLLDRAREQGRAEAIEIGELCQLAGMPALIPGFLSAGRTVAEVRKALIDARAEADAKAGEISHHQPRPRTPTAAALESWDRAFERVPLPQRVGG